MTPEERMKKLLGRENIDKPGCGHTPAEHEALGRKGPPDGEPRMEREEMGEIPIDPQMLAMLTDDEREAVDEILTKLGEAGMYLSNHLSRPDYGDMRVFGILGLIWVKAGLSGATMLAVKDGRPMQVGAQDMETAMGSLFSSVLLAGIRYGQAHPNAYTGAEGMNEGDMLAAIEALIAGAHEGPANGGSDSATEEE
jgi:hypothetical protein